MVDGQVRPANVTRYGVLDAMLHVPRENFVPHTHRPLAYADMQIPLAPGRVMLEPRTLGRLFDALEVPRDSLSLVVGAGLGYTAAVMARLATTVVAVEEDAELARSMEDRLAAAEVDNVIVRHGELADGMADAGPYDTVLIEGGVEQVPRSLKDQLADGGKLCAICIEGALGTATLWQRSGAAISSRRLFNALAPVLPGFDAERPFTL
jgi:protein-L-isoaspartate(D-aspartate) O-methyltransferase